LGNVPWQNSGKVAIPIMASSPSSPIIAEFLKACSLGYITALIEWYDYKGLLVMKH